MEQISNHSAVYHTSPQDAPSLFRGTIQVLKYLSFKYSHLTKFPTIRIQWILFSGELGP